LGIFGYLYHYDHTPDNILLAYSDDVLFIGLKLGYTLVIIFSYPVVNYATRSGIDSIFFKSMGRDIPIYRIIVEAIIIVAFTYGVAMGVPSIDIVFGFVGSTLGQLVVFINPALYYLFLYDVELSNDDSGIEVEYEELHQLNWRKVITLRKSHALVLIIFGILCGIISVYTIIDNLSRLKTQPS